MILTNGSADKKATYLPGNFLPTVRRSFRCRQKAGIDTNTLEYSADGSPFWAVPENRRRGHRTRLPQRRGAFTLTGIAAAIIKGVLVAATAATFTLSGQAANLKKGYTLPCSAGSFTLSGQSAGLSNGKSITAGVGSFYVYWKTRQHSG
jgi:hypothetical protein